MAHIKGERPGSNRHDPSQTAKERNAYENLILLCPSHHTLIDRPENADIYNVACLLQMKAANEEFINNRLERLRYTHKTEVAEQAYPLMKENYEVFINYGPHSEIARKHPQSDVHAVWLSERLTTIIPNNRCLLKLMETNKELFAPKEQAILAKFALHARSYESWVRDETSYEGVVRFPSEFEQLITGLVDAS